MSNGEGIKRVALAFPLAVPHLTLTLRGITDYARRHAKWTFITSFPSVIGADQPGLLVRSLKDWPGDGVMALIATEADARAARELGLPVVNMTGVVRDAGLPRVMADQQTIGRLAAEHLLDRGLGRFAFYGFREVWYSKLRCQAFVRRVEQAGGQCSVYEQTARVNPRQPWHHYPAGLDRWLETLKPPVGLMAVHDYRARVVVDECDRLGLRVPDDVVLIGADNNQIVCEFCQPPLTSISRNDYQIGYQAAALLDRLMAGEQPPEQDILIPPGEVVARRSTDLVAFDDPHVTTAVRYVRRHVAEPFGVEALLKLVPVSRRQLEKRFKQFLGRTPHEYICHVRVGRAKQLLAGPEKMKIKDVAVACGFPDTQRFRIVFRRLVGTTPIDYRRSRRTNEPPSSITPSRTMGAECR